MNSGHSRWHFRRQRLVEPGYRNGRRWIEQGNQDYAQLFVDSGRVSVGGLTQALVAAAQLANASLAERLLAAGADPNASSDGRPLLCRTLLLHSGQTLALALVMYGANPNADCGRPHIGESTPLTLVDDTDH